MDENNTAFTTQDGVLFNADRTALLCYPAAKTGEEYVVPSTVTAIGEWAFQYNTNLTKVSFTASVAETGRDVFFGCTNLKEILVDEGNAVFASSDGILFNRDKTSLLCYPAGREENAYSAPEGVLSIGDGAFTGCGLTRLVLPDGLTAIGSGAFEECESLTSISIPDSVTVIGDNAFWMCSGLTHVTIPAAVEEIGLSTFFECSSLQSIVIPANVKSLGLYAFSYCTGLKEINFKGDAPAMAEECFTNVTATAYYPADNQTWTAEVMQNYGGSLTWTAREKGYALTSTAISWDENGDEVICLYSGLSEDEVKTDITSGAAGARYTAQCGEAVQNADGERFDLAFSFADVEAGEYILAIYKPGNYVLLTASVTVSGDAGLGEFALQLTGDVSGDGNVNTMDLIRLMKYISGVEVDVAPGTADVNGDGRENTMDLIRLMKIVNGEAV